MDRADEATFNLSDAPLRAHVGDYPSVAPADGIRMTWDAFQALEAQGRLHPAAP